MHTGPVAPIPGATEQTMSDYRIPRIRAYRLQAESLRAEAESTRLFWESQGQDGATRAAVTLSQADVYDRMADQAQAELDAAQKAAAAEQVAA